MVTHRVGTTHQRTAATPAARESTSHRGAFSSRAGAGPKGPHGYFFQDLDRLLLFAVLLAQPPQFVALGAGQLAALALAPVCLGLAVPAAQGL